MLNHSSLCCSRGQARQALASENLPLLLEERFLLLLRADFLAQAEAELLSLSRQHNFLSMLLLLRIYQGNRSGVESLLETVSSSRDETGLFWFAKQTLLLWKGGLSRSY